MTGQEQSKRSSRSEDRCAKQAAPEDSHASSSSNSKLLGALKRESHNQLMTSERASSPGKALIDETSRDDVPRRANIPTERRWESLNSIKAAAPDLALSGNVISTTFTLPYTFKYRESGQWELNAGHGQSALYDSFAYLSSNESLWNHTIVAWTGQIEFCHVPLSPPRTPPESIVIPSVTPPVAQTAVDQASPKPLVRDGLRISHEHKMQLEQKLSCDKKIKAIPVWLCDDDDLTEHGIQLRDQSRWRRYADHELYPLLHYKQHEPVNWLSERIQWANYYQLNLKFASKILEVYKPGDLVVIHDYHLMLLPAMLRQQIPGMYISFFLHCPFPSSELLRCLPRRNEVLEGVLGANLVCFQSYSYARHFLSCCSRILGFSSDSVGVDTYGRRVEVGVFPIGIDVARVEQIAWSPSIDDKIEALKKLYKGKRMIVGRDRLDSVRGVVQKLMAFERFLEQYPAWSGKVVLIQVTSPSSIEEGSEDPEKKMVTRVNELVTKINSKYGSLGFAPVQHYPQYLSTEEYFALLRLANIGLITSVRDGMNTTSLEYVVCQRDTYGPLIISEFSGTAGSLNDAIHINPWNLGDVAKKINIALEMPKEARMCRQESLYRYVTTNNVQAWITKLLHKLVATLDYCHSTTITPLLDRTVVLKRYRGASNRLFMVDYDGTLTPIVKDPSAALPSEREIQILKALAADPHNTVWIISGRDQEFLQQYLGHIPELGFSAEHGSFIRHPGRSTWENLAEKLNLGWQEDVMAIFQRYSDRVHGSFVERKRCALTWHYRQADAEQGAYAALEAQKELESAVVKNWNLDVVLGKANVEVRPTSINKGEIVKRLVLNHTSTGLRALAGRKTDFLVCIGDDTTDEDMFRAVDGLSAVLDDDSVFTIRVGAGTRVTLARWHVLEPKEVIDCLALLAGLGKAGNDEDSTTMSQVNAAQQTFEATW